MSPCPAATSRGGALGIGRRDQLDVEVLPREIAALPGDDEGRVVGIDEPVEDHSELFGGEGGGAHRRQGDEGCRGQTHEA